MSKARELAELGDTLTVDGSGNIDVTGTVTADELKVENGATKTGINENTTAWAIAVGAGVSRGVSLESQSNLGYIGLNISNNTDTFASTADPVSQTYSRNLLDISGTGDISFYEDTGATPKFFWDASAESLGIGTAVPSSDVDILGSSSRIRLDGSSSSFQILSRNTADSTTNALTFDADSYTFNRAGSAKAVIDSSGNVGIGTAAPAVRLQVEDTAGAVLRIKDSSSSYSNIHFADAASDFAGFVGYNHGTDYLSLGTSATERMRIDASGNVGIGTAAPISIIDARASGVSTPSVLSLIGTNSGSSTSCVSQIKSSENAAGSGAADLTFHTRSAGAAFATPAERMRVNSSGNVRINNTDAGNYRLKIAYDGTGEEGIGLQTTYAGTSNMIRFLNSSGTTVGLIRSTTSSTSYVTTSDYRLKENITPVQGAADIVKAMRPVTYNFKADSTDWHDGFLAHELQELHPRAVTGEKDAMRDEEYEVTPAVYEDVIIPAVDAVVDEDGNVTQEAQPERTEQRLVSEAVMGTRSVPDYQGVDYSKLTPILTAALQEALNKIDALEARLTALEGTV